MTWAVDNWPVIGGFAAGLVTWGKTVNDVSQNKKDIANALTDIGGVKDAIARIETHQEYTRTGIDEIRDELRGRR